MSQVPFPGIEHAVNDFPPSAEYWSTGYRFIMHQLGRETGAKE